MGREFQRPCNLSSATSFSHRCSPGAWRENGNVSKLRVTRAGENGGIIYTCGIRQKRSLSKAWQTADADLADFGSHVKTETCVCKNIPACIHNEPTQHKLLWNRLDANPFYKIPNRECISSHKNDHRVEDFIRATDKPLAICRRNICGDQT